MNSRAIEQSDGVIEIESKDQEIVRREIGFLVGSWEGDPEVEKALEAQRQIDPELWS